MESIMKAVDKMVAEFKGMEYSVEAITRKEKLGSATLAYSLDYE